ncbi:MAG: hypothetical protein H6853_07085 [Rhodospirillales bacterium]|nr:hypothetical protein [Alphaproteobacteria bacterium]USO03292.1 MAG: hypothetical protein H6853_07085 [Rhodospirillales bacterium]
MIEEMKRTSLRNRFHGAVMGIASAIGAGVPVYHALLSSVISDPKTAFFVAAVPATVLGVSNYITSSIGAAQLGNNAPKPPAA